MKSAEQPANGRDFSGLKTFETRKIDKASEFLESVYGASAKVDFYGDRDEFGMQFKFVALGDVALAKASVSNWTMTRNTEAFVHITVPVKGVLSYQTGARCVDVAPGRHASVGRPCENLKLKVERGTGLALYLPVTGLIERAERLTGASFDASLLTQMVESVDLAAPVGAALARNMQAAMAEIGSLYSVGLGSLAMVGYEELLLNFAVVSLFPGIAQKVGRPQPDCGPRVIRRARDHINAHAAEPIELAQLASQLGISMRGMQVSFQRYFGFSPRDYIIECRLERARKSLLAADDNTSVTNVALDSGFTDLSHFSAKYRDKFGELPSETLRAALRH